MAKIHSQPELACGTRESLNGHGALIGVLKRQDPSPAQGMVTAGKELSTHLDAGKLNIFGLLTGITPS